MENKGIGKIEVEGYEAPTLRTAGIDKDVILGRAQTLFRYCGNVVPSPLEKLDSSRTKILVELESHFLVSEGMSTYRPRDISAPYAKHA